MRKLLVVLFCIFSLTNANLIGGNVQVADSLLRTAPSEADGKRMTALNKAAELLMHDRPDSAARFAKEALSIAQSLQILKGEADATALLGSMAYLRGEMDTALSYHRKALQIRRGLPEKRDLADSYNDLGALHDRDSREDSALNYYQKALAIFQELNDQNGISQSYNNIGVFYVRTDNFPQAIEMFLKSAKIDGDLNNLNGLGYDYSNLGACYSTIGDSKKSLEYHRKALDIRVKSGNQLQVSRSLNNIAMAYLALGDFPNSISYMQQSLKIKQQLGHGWEVLETLNNLTEVYVGANELVKAKATSDMALHMADSMNAPAHKVTALTHLASIYEKRKDYKAAFEVQKAKNNLRDSLFTAEKNSQLAEMQAKFEAAQQQMKIDQLGRERDKAEVEVSKVQSRNSILIAVILIVVVIAVFFFSLASLRARSNRELSRLNLILEDSNHEIAAKNFEIERQKGLLEEQNHKILDINTVLENLVEERTADLRRANDELDTFLYQSSHAMRAPILRLQGLFELMEQENDAKTRLELSTSIQITLDRIDGMLRKLNQVSGLSRREVRPAPIALDHTVEDALASMAFLTPEERSHLKIELISAGQLFTDPGLLRIILANLLENAYQFRNPGETDPKVEIELVQSDEETNLFFRDFGQGIPYRVQSKVFGMFVRGTEASKGEGLGLYVVKKATERLGAEIEMTSAPGRTEFKFTFHRDSQG